MTDDLDLIHEALTRDGFYLDPSLSGQFSPAQITALKAGLAAADQPTYVVAFPLRDNDTYGGSAADLLTRLHDRYPEPGVYLSTTTEITVAEYQEIRLEGRQYGLPGEPDGDLSDYELLYAVSEEGPPDLGAAFVRAVELQNAGPEAISKAYETARAKSEASESAAAEGGTSGSTGTTSEPAASGSDAGSSGPGTVVVLSVLLALLVAWLVVSRARRRRPPRPPVVEPTTLTLPATAVERIREAHERRLEAEAREEVLALGADVDRVDLGTAARVAGWEAAQQHYVAARELLEGAAGDDATLDVVGALVLARRGRAALEAARKGRRDWHPPATCFLNPLHGRVAAQVAVGATGRGRSASQEVPVCGECLEAVEGRTRPDYLDVERRGKSVHYFDSDVEPWASTGYGALDDDLLGALRRTRSPDGH
ncbi:hypothetical protein BH11ACT8_BH11ACT8_27210 [soil metagenome]